MDSKFTQDILNKTVALRNEVRKYAIKNKNNELTQLGDKLREDFIEMGIKIVDSGEDSMWSMHDKDSLLKEREAKAKQVEEEQMRKQQINNEKNLKKQQKDDKMKINPVDMFRNDPEYSGYEFDADGIPIKNEKIELTKNQLKKLRKAWDAQKKLQDQFLAGTVETNNQSEIKQINNEKDVKKDKLEKKEKTSGSEGYEINLKDLNHILSINMFTEGDIITKNDFEIIKKIKNECKEKDLDKYPNIIR